MNTKELVDCVRDGLLEYQTLSISNDMIMRRLNNAYRKIYNHYARANPDMFAIPYTLTLIAGQSEYDFPENLWSKRIHKVMMPYPNSSTRGYYPLEIISYKDSYKYNIKDLTAPVSSVVSVSNNTLTFYPAPSDGGDCIIYLTPRLVPLGYTFGTVAEYDDATKTITVIGNESDGTIESDIITTLGTAYKGIISISDFYTGLIKHLYPVTSVSGSDIVIGAPTDRSVIFDQTVEDATAGAITDIDPDDCVTLSYSTGVSIFGEAFDEYLENYATLKIGSNINETNAVLSDMFSEIEKTAKSDTVGRPALQTITRVRSGIRLGTLQRSVR